MARKPRLEFPGAIYHINHRGNHQALLGIGQKHHNSYYGTQDLSN